MSDQITLYPFNSVKIISHPSNVYSQGMNDIAAPILLVFIAHELGVSIEDLDDPEKQNEIMELLKEETLLKVDFTSPRRIVIFVLPTFSLE